MHSVIMKIVIYCSKVKTQQNSMEIKNTTFWFRIQTILQSLLSKSRSLLEDVDTNSVERFNSVIAKVVGGKRSNFSLRQGYRACCNAAVVSFNNTQFKSVFTRQQHARSETFREDCGI